MTELWIKFTDDDGYYRRVLVGRDRFVIGRHSSCDLAIANSKLSREHLVIEQVGDEFTVYDLGSSNGTELNGELMAGPVTIRNGDVANLGGGLDIEFDLVSDESGAVTGVTSWPEAECEGVDVPAAGQPSVAPAVSPSAAETNGFPISFLILAPLMGLVLLLSGIGLIYVFSGGSTPNISKNDPNSHGSSDPEENDNGPGKIGTTSSPSTTSSSGTNVTSTGNTTTAPPTNLGENAKVEQAAAAFLRRIAQNDPNAFLTAEQSKKVSGAIKQIGSSSALADNINSARKNAAQIKSLATAKNLKPQLLATAALTKLGNSKGDVLQTAGQMADILEKLQTQIGSELYDDSLLMIAAYDQGQNGDFMHLRNMLQDLATKFPESARAIRSIWFLQKQGKITDAEFQFAIRFLAIGTITQTPKDFGINAEPLTL